MAALTGMEGASALLEQGHLSVSKPLPRLQATPGLGWVVIDALLNVAYVAYETNGRVQGRILVLLDEVAHLGPMTVLKAARDAGRKCGLTLSCSTSRWVNLWSSGAPRAPAASPSLRREG